MRISSATPLRSARCRMLSRIGRSSVGSTLSRPSPRAKPRYSSTSLDISPTSWRRPDSAGSCSGADQLELELHPGQRRAQVVADRRQHLGALADVAQDAMAHQVEGMRGLADLERAARPEVADVAALAEAVGGPGELADRADLQAQEVDRDRARAPIELPTIQVEQEPGRRAGDPLAAARTISSTPCAIWT